MKTNKSVYRTWTMTEEEYKELYEEYRGLCIYCGEEHDDNLEPDAYRIKCDNCGKNGVCGAEALINNDRIIFSEGV